MPSAALRATVLLTRPQPDSERFAALLPEDVPVVISPILRIQPVLHDADRLARAPGLVFTSAHAVGSAGPGRGRPALCVGPRTAALARQAGFEVTEGSGDAQGLLPLIAAADLPLIHPHGRHVAQVLPVEGMVVYDQLPVPLSDHALRLLAGPAPVVVPLFSPRSARLLSLALPPVLAAPLRLAPISESALSEWLGPLALSRLAGRPDAEGVRNAVIHLLSPQD
ncbi:uroporphyrinogen-III synthase [Paracoccus sp. M683]|uniref:uroporphyrinogen-III synthase n=1 Tax=Paracoccus sp. M683 TaxID=2594268 RepID=UPI001180F091|nr:uroporphyrinogen-III synthase [Paracoccus sp. M683]TRW99508.1 uroporphyrinogen-III synthase [Paracoccus sp. M683]